MMSLEVIVAVNNQIARQAAREGLVPYVPVSADEATSPFAFPNIGSLKPRGWQRTGQTWFVDKTGHGRDLGACPDLAAVPSASHGIPPSPSRPRLRHRRGGRVPGRRLGVQAGLMSSVRPYKQQGRRPDPRKRKWDSRFITA